MIETLLVANRGEIARRVFRTARAMGMRCVAVFTDADAGAPHVTDADVAIRLPDGGYLDAAAIIAAAFAGGADAVHPGYGFLSENAGFARAVAAEGLTWVGPQPDVIAAMGDKLAAKRAAIAAGVPTLPTFDLGDADGVAFPVLVKAAAGGGGKGMRIVESAAELDEAVAAAKREAAHSFGDDTVFLERYVPRSRHIEIQILGDAHGALVHLGERDCSIQRRHQKIVEESPSPVVDDAMRAAMGDAALRLARSIGYQSAGTVEFLVDDETREFFFLEVNTRLQVEHPVTEEVTGIDLVREQLRIAEGQPLGWTQDDVTFRGHAIEVRLYAEDPANGYLPATGTIAAFEPASAPAVRWESGVESGSVVGVEYDPMLAKIIAHAPTRDEAARRLALALQRLHFGGVTTNRDLLVTLLQHPQFQVGDTTTDFLERVNLTPNGIGIHRVVIAAALWLQGINRADAGVLEELPTGWRNARLPDQRVVLAHDGIQYPVDYHSRRDGAFVVRVDSPPSTAVVHRWSPAGADVEVDGHRTWYRITRVADRIFVQTWLGTSEFEIVPRFIPPGAVQHAGGFVAAMPGVVLDVRCAPGDAVTAGQTLVVLEAMKMEHRMNAPADGTVAEVRVSPGQHVELGAVLVVFDEHDSTEGSDAP